MCALKVRVGGVSGKEGWVCIASRREIYKSMDFV